MASLQRRSSGLYLLSFRYLGQLQQRSLETTDETEALRLKKLVMDRLKHLIGGVLKLPAGATADDLWLLLFHGGMVVDLPSLVRKTPLGIAADRYLETSPQGAKEESTLETETVHLNNLKRVLGKTTPLHTITASDLEGYIRTRLGESGNRGGRIKPDTVRKELQTFRLIWFFAKGQKQVQGECPLEEVRLPKKRRRPRFETWEQIEARVARGGLSEEQIAELWDCLFLRSIEVADFLKHVREASNELPRFTFIYPALCLCWYTGARRSEMFRCQVDDIAHNAINLREKKRDTDYEFSYRSIPIVPELNQILTTWLASHPGGQYLFCKNGGQPLDDRTSREAFKAVTKKSKWQVLRGYHVLRHSFASNLAMKGIDDRIIRKLMGHESEDMTKRYQHHFPEQEVGAINVLSGV